jgi:hypothetical protein
MKKTAFYMTLSLLMLGGLFVDRAQAQSSACQRFVATIPFEFKIGKATLPAGDYGIQCSSLLTDTKVLRVKSSDRADSAMIQASTVRGRSSGTTKLVFNRYGNEYFLAQLWVSGDEAGIQVRKSNAERDLSKQIAQTRKQVETVARLQR